MTCEEIEQQEVAEDYLLGRLSEADLEAFERHYFECGDCYARVEALRIARNGLNRSSARDVRLPTITPWMALAAAVVLVVGGAALAWRVLSEPGIEPGQATITPGRTTPEQPAIPEEVVRLARIEPPPYAPRRLRSGDARARFEAAMSRYQAGDFTATVPPLEQIVRSTPDDEAARFYLGASYALTSRWRDAVTALQPLISRRDSAYAEEAAFITALANVHLNDVSAALAALDATIAFEGERVAEARALRARLAALPSR